MSIMSDSDYGEIAASNGIQCPLSLLSFMLLLHIDIIECQQPLLQTATTATTSVTSVAIAIAIVRTNGSLSVLGSPIQHPRAAMTKYPRGMSCPRQIQATGTRIFHIRTFSLGGTNILEDSTHPPKIMACLANFPTNSMYLVSPISLNLPWDVCCVGVLSFWRRPQDDDAWCGVPGR